MSVIKTTTYVCDMCKKELPEEYKNTDGEGGRYFMWDVYNEVPLSPPVKDCVAARVKVTLGGKHDDRRYTDICNSCKLKLLRTAVKHYEAQEAAQKANEQLPGQLSIEDMNVEGGVANEGQETDLQPT